MFIPALLKIAALLGAAALVILAAAFLAIVVIECAKAIKKSLKGGRGNE